MIGHWETRVKMGEKILYTIETHGPGGAESMVLNLGKAFNSKQFNSYGYFIKKGWLADRFKENLIPSGMGQSRYVADLPLLFSLVGFLKKNDIKLIHAHEFTMGFYSVLASRILRIPCVVTFHGKSERVLDKKIRLWAFQFILKQADHVVAVSHDLKSWLKSHFKNGEEVSVIHNGISVSDFTYSLEKKKGFQNQIVRLLKLQSDACIITTVARLFPVKGIELLIKAAANVVKVMPSAHFILAGDGPEKRSLKQLSRSLGVDSNIHFLGECNNIPDILAGSDLFVLSSHSEGLSISILEAMASSLPIVATDVGDNRHQVFNGENGYIVPPGEPALMAERILDLLTDLNKMRHFGDRSRKMVQIQFDEGKMIYKYNRLYKQLISGCQPGFQKISQNND